MAEKFLMPKLSPTMEEGQISRWLKNEGDSFEANETLAEVDTDKATMEMTAIKGGTLLKILKQAGETAALGEAIAIVGEKGEDISALLSETASAAQARQSQSAHNGQDGEKPAEEAKNVAAQSEARPAPQAAPAAEAEANIPPSARPANGNGRIFVSPIAARMAAEHNLDIKTIQGTGPSGRIIKRDIEKALASVGSTTQARLPQFTVSGAAGFHDEPVSKMRQVIASRLSQSIGPVPTFYLTVDVELDNLLALRKQINSTLSENEKISVNDIIVKAAAMALMHHPWVNAAFLGDKIRFYERADIGVAVAIDEGLITPVIRGANLKGLAAISSEIKELAARARERKLQPEEYTGATFSVSNLGMMGIREFTAIINPPESGILAIGAGRETPVVRNGEITVKTLMTVTMSCDHRIVDGATGARFLETLKKYLENPGLMLL